MGEPGESGNAILTKADPDQVLETHESELEDKLFLNPDVSQIENFVSPGLGPPVDGRYNCYFFNANGDRVTVAYQLEGCPDVISTQAEKTRSQQFTKHKPPLKGEDPLTCIHTQYACHSLSMHKSGQIIYDECQLSQQRF